MKNLVRRLIISALLINTLLAGTTLQAQAPPSSHPGKFLDELQLKDTGNGLNFELLAEFRYLDPTGFTWAVPMGQLVNGASIPKALWSTSVIHDYFFRQQKYNSDAVHRVFYDAMITDGVRPLKAKVMYWAVLRFNDSWKGTSALGDCSPDGKLNCLPILADDPIPITWSLVSMPFDEKELERAEKLIEATDPSLAEIERLAKEARAAAKANR